MIDDEEITQRIDLWWLYGAVGNPEEADYSGGGGGAGGSLESRYRSPQIWHPRGPRTIATKADYDLVEPIYRARGVRDRMTIAYYAGHKAKPIAFIHREVWDSFRSDVGRA